MKEDGESKNIYTSNWILVVLLCFCFALIGWCIGRINSKEENKTEVKDEQKKEEKVIEKKKISPLEIINPYLEVIGFDGENGDFYYQNVNTYEDLTPTKAIEIALENYNKESKNESGEEFPDIETSYIKEGIKYTFGKDKDVKFPLLLNFEKKFESYELKGDKYVLAGQGGGYIELYEHTVAKYVSCVNKDGKVIIRVNYVYITYDEEEKNKFDDLSDVSVILYNSQEKDRVVAKGFKHGDEKEEIDKVLDGNNTDYLLFTFKVEDNHYVFEKVETVKR